MIILSAVVAIVKSLGFVFLIVPIIAMAVIGGYFKDTVFIVGHGIELAIEWCDS